MSAAAPRPAQSHDLHQALDRALQFGPSYPSGTMRLSSHLPMVLTALWRLGAPVKSLQRQLDVWSAKLPPAEPVSTTGTLAELLPGLLDAPETAAFHGAIRLAYAVEADHADEQQATLAAWRDARRTLGPALPAIEGTLSLRAVIDRVRADPGLALPPREGGSIMSHMLAAAQLPAFADCLALPRLSLDALAEASLAVYLASRDFTALHLVTGLHAVRVLLCAAAPAVVDEGQVLRTLWRAWLAAYLSIGRPAPAWAIVHTGSASEADWDMVRPALADSLDDHRIKLADSAREEWRLRGWPGYALCLQSGR